MPPRLIPSISLMSKSRTHRIPVVCALGRQPEYVDWLHETVESDRVICTRAAFTIPLSDDAKSDALRDAEVFAAYRFSPAEFRGAPHLKWLHLGVAGVDSAMFPAMKKSRVVVTSSVGLHRETVPPAVWSFILSFATGLHTSYNQKRDQRWDRKAIVLDRALLSTQRLLVIGTGVIGSEVARIGQEFGMDVWGVRRSRSAAPLRYFDRVLSARGLCGALKAADYVVLAVPGGPETRHLIGAMELRCMKPTAYLINVARGSVVDEMALIRALQRGEIAGAGLDVFAEEPLPPTHPFYRLDNVAMTPHTAGDTLDYAYRATEMFLRNLRRYLQRKPLSNIVDKRRGY